MKNKVLDKIPVMSMIINALRSIWSRQGRAFCEEKRQKVVIFHDPGNVLSRGWLAAGAPGLKEDSAALGSGKLPLAAFASRQVAQRRGWGQNTQTNFKNEAKRCFVINKNVWS
jgi:hypothetical protein